MGQTCWSPPKNTDLKLLRSFPHLKVEGAVFNDMSTYFKRVSDRLQENEEFSSPLGSCSIFNSVITLPGENFTEIFFSAVSQGNIAFYLFFGFRFCMSVLATR